MYVLLAVLVHLNLSSRRLHVNDSVFINPFISIQ